MAASCRSILWLPLVVFVLVLSTKASAQTDKVAAEALFSQARKLMADGNYGEACSKFEQSQRLDPGIGTLLYLADCYEKTKRYASAWATFREGASGARASGQNDRANAGESRANALEPRLSRLTVSVAKENADIPNLTIQRESTNVPKEVWGVAVPVDGGTYVIRARAPGYLEWSGKVSVEAEKATAKVDVPALVKDESATVEPPPAPPPTATPTVTPPPQKDEPETSDGSTQRTIGIVVAGVGVVGVGIGTLFGFRAIAKNSDAKELCDGATCRDERGVTLTDDAKSAATISNVAFGAGLACLAGGIILYVTAPSSQKEKPTARRRFHVAPMADRRAAGFALGGSF
jgi:serine/threonine-protein kinase